MRLSKGRATAFASAAVLGVAVASVLIGGCRGSGCGERVTVAGSELRVGGERFFAYGYNFVQPATERLFSNPTRRNERRMAKVLTRLRHRYLANSVRIFLEFPTFMPRPKRLDRDALQGLEWLVARAEVEGLRLVLVGNVTTRASRARRWYERMGEARRWDTQALFWRRLAARLRGSESVLFYELANEPIVPNEPARSWYVGELGGQYWAQNVVKDLGGRDPDAVAERWTRKMSRAVDRSDPGALVSIGSFSPPGTQNPFRPAVLAPYLDLFSVHEYPDTSVGPFSHSSGNRAAAEIRQWAKPGKPLVLSEVYAREGGFEALDAYLRETRDYLSGAISHYGFTDPDSGSRLILDEAERADEARNLDIFLGLHPLLCRGAC